MASCRLRLVDGPHLLGLGLHLSHHVIRLHSLLSEASLISRLYFSLAASHGVLKEGVAIEVFGHLKPVRAVPIEGVFRSFLLGFLLVIGFVNAYLEAEGIFRVIV